MISPPGPPATHSLEDGHEMADNDVFHAISNLLQLERRAAGAVETTTPPALSTATHRASVGHETAASDCEKWYGTSFQADELPVGFTVDARLAALPATHRDDDGQEISPPLRHSSGDAKSVRTQRGRLAVGFFDQSTPWGPIATHTDRDTHEILLTPVPLASWTTRQLDAPAAGSRELAMSPRESTATHAEVEAHEMPTGPFSAF